MLTPKVGIGSGMGNSAVAAVQEGRTTAMVAVGVWSSPSKGLLLS